MTQFSVILSRGRKVGGFIFQLRIGHSFLICRVEMYIVSTFCLCIVPPCSCTNVHFLGPNCQVEHWARLDLCMARHWQDWQVSMSMFKWCRPAVDQSETETDQMHLLQAKYLPLIISVATCSTLISNINFNCIMCNDELCGQTVFLRGSGTNVDESQAETDRMHLCSK